MEISNLINRPLDEQCAALGLPLEKIFVPQWESPEAAALNYFQMKGYSGFRCESGAILTIIKAACLNELASKNLFGRQDACTRFLEAQFTLCRRDKERIVEAIRIISPDEFVDNFDEVLSHPFVNQCYPDLNRDTANLIFQALGTDQLAAIAELLFSDPYRYRNGWPDLTLVRTDKLMFVEVKTTDKLHESQLMTIPVLKNVLLADFQVVILKKIIATEAVFSSDK